MFYTKLNFIMELTDTSNSSLAKACSLDSSYISRLRSGNRQLPKNQSYLDSMINYLLGRVRETYQLNFLMKAINCTSHPSNDQELFEAVKDWLISSEPTNDIGTLLSEFEVMSDISYDTSDNNPYFYYGTKGKQDAVKRFLTEVISSGKQHTLRLYTDENSSWLTENPEFVQKWSQLMMELMSRGNRIQIIHPVDLKYGEMQESMENWMGLYMTGLIEPYYYKGILDGIFSTTWFIAPGKAAIVSSNIKDTVKDNLTIYLTDPKAVAAVEREFNSYFSLCERLMNHYFEGEYKEYWRYQKHQYSSNDTLTCVSSAPSLLSMPESILKNTDKLELENDIGTIRELQEILINSLNNRQYYEFLPLSFFDPENTDLPDYNTSNFLFLKDLKYSKTQLIDHLKNLKKLLSTVINYNLIIIPELPFKMQIQILGSKSALFTSMEQTPLAISYSEPRMMAALQDTLSRHQSPKNIMDKNLIVELIDKKIMSLQ